VDPAFLSPFFFTMKLAPMKRLELMARKRPLWLSSMAVIAGARADGAQLFQADRQAGYLPRAIRRVTERKRE
jgi:hypothetical protein